MSYLDERDKEIDKSEWIDIYYTLKALKPTRGETILELCSGKGYLLEYLSNKFKHNRFIGVDLEGCKYNKHVQCMDLNREDPPRADIIVFQHCIEHLNQIRMVSMLRYMMKNRTRAIIGIVPGHEVDDKTHVVNHYHLGDLHVIGEQIDAPYIIIRPDLHSYGNPSLLDYLVVYSKTPVSKVDTLPLVLGGLIILYRKLVSLYINR